MQTRSGCEPISGHPCLGVGAPRHGRAARSARRVVSQARGRLPRGPLGAVAGRPPRADLAHRRRAHPVRRHHVLRGGRGQAPAARRLRVRPGRGEGPRRRGVLVRSRHHRLGGRAPGAGAREPRRARSPRPFRREHDAGPRVPDRRPARRARAPEGHAQHLPRGLPGVHRGRVPARRPLRRRGGARDRQRPHPRDARAPGADRPPDGPLEPPRVPRAAPRGAPRRVDRPDARLARHARPRRLQARQRHLQPRHGRPRALGGRVDPPRSRPLDRHRLPGRRRGVRDHRARKRPLRRIPARRAPPGAHHRHAVRPGRAGQRVDRHRLGADPRREPPRARGVRRGRDDDREGARQGADRRVPGGSPRAPG